MELSYRKISLNLFAAKILTENIFNFVYFVLRGSNEKCAYLYTFVSDTRDYDLEPTNSHWCVTIPTNCAHTNWIQANRLRVISRKIFGVFPRIRIGLRLIPVNILEREDFRYYVHWQQVSLCDEIELRHECFSRERI